MQETIKKHPSYGMLGFYRVHGVFYQNRMMEASKQGLQLQGNPVDMIEVGDN